jgi:hypothetical protein
MKWALAALLLSTTALADPSPSLLPKEPPPAAFDTSGNGKWVVTGIVAGAALTAVFTVVAIVVASANRSGVQSTDCRVVACP